MRVSVVFYELTQKWEGTVEAPQVLTREEAAALLLRREGRNPAEELNGVIYMVDQARRFPDQSLAEGDILFVYTLLGGG